MSDVVQVASVDVSAAQAPTAPAKAKASSGVAKSATPAKKVVRREALKKSAVAVKTPTKKVVAQSVVKTAAKPVAKKAASATQKAVANTTELASKPAPKTPAPEVKAQPAAAVVEKLGKPKKLKMIRDSFTIPKDEMAVIDVLKSRALKLAHPIKKSELIRAGIKVLLALSDSAFMTAMKSVPVIKTGRPGK